MVPVLMRELLFFAQVLHLRHVATRATLVHLRTTCFSILASSSLESLVLEVQRRHLSINKTGFATMTRLAQLGFRAALGVVVYLLFFLDIISIPFIPKEISDEIVPVVSFSRHPSCQFLRRCLFAIIDV